MAIDISLYQATGKKMLEENRSESGQVSEPVVDHIEDMRGMVCIGEIHDDIIKADPLYKRGVEDGRKDCARCATHEKNIVEIIRDYDTKLAALEAANKRLADAIEASREGKS